MRILAGTAGWTDASLVRNGRYPSGTRTGADRLRHYASQFPLVEAEFRHGSRLEPEQRERTWKLRRSHDAAYVCTDMPQNHAGAIPPVLAATAAKAVICLHGHSPYRPRGDKEERYRYVYSHFPELSAWAERSVLLSDGSGSLTPEGARP